jgi:hypothetical protein
VSSPRSRRMISCDPARLPSIFLSTPVDGVGVSVHTQR